MSQDFSYTERVGFEPTEKSLPAPLLDHVNWVLARVMRRVTYR